MRRFLFLLLLVAFLSTLSPAVLQSESNSVSGVPESRFNHLRHGINLSHWFAQSLTGSYDRPRLTTYMTAQDFDLIKSMGFDHVRLTVEPAPLFNAGQPDQIEPERLSLLDDAVHMALARDLAVILDMHPSSEFKQKLNQEHGVEGFADFWRSLAAHYSKSDPERLFFEVLNEPEMTDPYRWYGIETRLIAAIRSVAPHHTIIASGHGWAGVTDLLALEPFADRNVLYNFHFYEPGVFTNQGATWGLELWHHLRLVRYPSYPGANDTVIRELPLFTQKIELVRYDQDRWNRSRIESEISLIAAWAREKGVRVTCNEFGVARQNANSDERAAWIRDVRTSLESHGIGWTTWDYAGGFAVAPGDPGKRKPDDQVLRALGLKK